MGGFEFFHLSPCKVVFVFTLSMLILYVDGLRSSTSIGPHTLMAQDIWSTTDALHNIERSKVLEHVQRKSLQVTVRDFEIDDVPGEYADVNGEVQPNCPKTVKFTEKATKPLESEELLSFVPYSGSAVLINGEQCSGSSDLGLIRSSSLKGTTRPLPGTFLDTLMQQTNVLIISNLETRACGSFVYGRGQSYAILDDEEIKFGENDTNPVKPGRALLIYQENKAKDSCFVEVLEKVGTGDSAGQSSSPLPADPSPTAPSPVESPISSTSSGVVGVESPSPGGEANNSKGGGSKIGIGLGAGLGGVAIGAIVVGLAFYLRKRRSVSTGEAPNSPQQVPA